MSSPLQPGSPFVSAFVDENGRIVLTHDDGTNNVQPVLLVKGELVDNGDGTSDLIFPEE